jgi:hypothetical protein
MYPLTTKKLLACPYSSWQEAAERRFPDAYWIKGNGPLAVVVSVPLVKTITLHPTLARAQEVKAHVERQLRRVKAWPNCEVVDLHVEGRKP